MISNNELKGDPTIGSGGWHIDGHSKFISDQFSFQYIVNAPHYGYGGTQLIDTNKLLELIQQMDEKFYNKLLGLFYKSPFVNWIFRLIYKDNYKDTFVINIHTDRDLFDRFAEMKCEGYEYENDFTNVVIVNASKEYHLNGNDLGRECVVHFLSVKESESILMKFEQFIDTICEKNGLVFVTNYKQGDLLIRDNLSLLHRAHPSSLLDEREIGLRLLWRINVKYHHMPRVIYSPFVK